MKGHTITESRTTIVFMSGFGAFIILAYLLVAAPLKKEQEQVTRSIYNGEVQAKGDNVKHSDHEQEKR
jgi:hypothetical protein